MNTAIITHLKLHSIFPRSDLYTCTQPSGVSDVILSLTIKNCWLSWYPTTPSEAKDVNLSRLETISGSNWASPRPFLNSNKLIFEKMIS